MAVQPPSVPHGPPLLPQAHSTGFRQCRTRRQLDHRLATSQGIAKGGSRRADRCPSPSPTTHTSVERRHRPPAPLPRRESLTDEPDLPTLTGILVDSSRHEHDGRLSPTRRTACGHARRLHGGRLDRPPGIPDPGAVPQADELEQPPDRILRTDASRFCPRLPNSIGPYHGSCFWRSTSSFEASAATCSTPPRVSVFARESSVKGKFDSNSDRGRSSADHLQVIGCRLHRDLRSALPTTGKQDVAFRAEGSAQVCGSGWC